jgi:hypothetical protein
MFLPISGCASNNGLSGDEDKQTEEETQEATEGTIEIVLTEETTEVTVIETKEPNVEIQQLMILAADALLEVASYRGTMELVMDATVSDPQNGEIRLGSTMNLAYDYYGPANYVHSVYSMTIVSGSNEQKTGAEYYIVEEDGEYRIYTWNNGTWIYTSEMFNEYFETTGVGQTDVFFDIASEYSSEFVLAEVSQTIDDKEVYVIEGVLTGDSLRMLFDTSFALSSASILDISNFDYDHYSVPIVIMLYADTNYLAYVHYDLTEILEDMIIASYAESGQRITARANMYDFTLSLSAYNEMSEPTIPQEVLDAVS